MFRKKLCVTLTSTKRVCTIKCHIDISISFDRAILFNGFLLEKDVDVFIVIMSLSIYLHEKKQLRVNFGMTLQRRHFNKDHIHCD